MSNTLIKFAVLLLAIKEIWLLLGVPAVVNAVTSFLMMGQLPGTDHPMSPSGVIRLVIVLFILLGLLIFRREIVKLVRFVFRRRLNASEVHPVAAPIPHPFTPMQVIAPTEEPAHQTLETYEPTVMRHWTWRLRAVALLGWVKFNVVVISAHAHADQYIRVVIAYIQVWSIILAQCSKATALFVAHKAIAVWRWTEPYLRRFDAYLERKLHEYDTATTLLSLGSEMTSTVQKWRGNVSPKEQRK